MYKSMFSDDPSIFPTERSKYAAAVFRVSHPWDGTCDELWGFVRSCFPQSYGRNIAAFDLAVEKGKARWLVLASSEKVTVEQHTIIRALRPRLHQLFDRPVCVGLDYEVEPVCGVPAYNSRNRDRSKRP